MTTMPDYSDLSYTLAGVKRSNPYDRRRRFAEQMMQTGVDSSPVQHPLQGAARLAQALVGGWMGGQADRDEEAAAKKQQDAFATAMSETDPQKRISMIAAVDPALGARLSGQLAIEQHKLGQQREGLQTAAGNFGASYGAPSGGGYQGTLAGLESSNNPTAVNPQSGAAGTYQFMPATWQDVRGQRPDLNLPGSPTQASPQQQGQAEQHFRQNNARALQLAGVPVNDMTLYVAHRAGADGARAILGADPNAPMSSIVPAKWIEQNPDMRGTVGQFLSLAQQRFGGGNAQRPTPLTINMTPGGPSNAPQPQIPQGDNAGMPPAPSPQAVSGPVLQAPAVPETPRPTPTPQQIAQYQQRLMTGEFGNDQGAASRARAALEAELDRDWQVRRDQDKMRFTQETEAYKDQRDRNQPSRNEVEKLQAARSDAAAIVSALDDFNREFKNTGTWGAIKSVAGYNTPVNTAYNAAALLAKGEQLFHLGVLTGPDLEIIRRTLPDPSTFKGAQTSAADMQTAVNKVVDLLQTRLGAREKQLGLPVTNVRQFAAEVRGATPQSPDAPPAATSFVGPDGRVVSMADIEETARNRGMDPAAVIQRLQLQAVR